MFIGALLMTPFYAIAPLMPGPWIAFVLLNIGGVGMMMLTAVSVTALLNITPAAIRAQIIATYYMTISLTGLFIGPTMVGFLSQHVYGEERLNLAVASIPVLFGAIPLLLIPVTRRLYVEHTCRLSGN
jgi:MFS family permease